MNRPYNVPADADAPLPAPAAEQQPLTVFSPEADPGERSTHLPRCATSGGQLSEPFGLLASVVEMLAGAASLQERLETAARQLRHAFGADACILRTLEDDDLRLAASSGLPRDRVRLRIPSRWSIAGEVLSGQGAICISDLGANPLTASKEDPPSESSDFASFAGAPLLASGRPVGILGLYFSQSPSRLKAVDLAALQSVAGAIALAVDRDRLHKVAEAQRQELEQHVEERRDLQLELLHAQKLETVGRLATRVVHDFNNMLTIVLNFNAMARDELDPEDQAQESLEKVAAACLQSAWLTQQLLAFAKKESGVPAFVRLHPLVRDAAQMMVGTLGPNIRVEVDVLTREDTVIADAGQLQNVLINLMINARDAMSACAAGTLTLRLSREAIDAPGPGSPRLAPGDYVCLRISDTGCGMTEEVRRRVFEPYFTTKAPGKGTGLGLATCCSAIRQHRGDILVESEPGKGSTFHILLPYVRATAVAPEAEPEDPGSPTGCETVLFVETRPWLREAACGGLRGFGYAVHTADSGREALETALAFPTHLAVAVTETTLPDMSGRELASRLTALCPHLRILYVSSDEETDIAEDSDSAESRSVLQKPYTRERLARKLREVLDAPGRVPPVREA